MALMDVFKKKKPEAELPPMPAGMPPGLGLPVNQIGSMKQQGLSNQEISQTLKEQGYTTQQIYDAMAQAEIKPQEEPFAAPVERPMPAARPLQGAPKFAEKSHEGFEEIAESIIEEKWHELTRDLDKMNEWKELSNSRIDKIEQSITDIKADLDNLHKAIVGKIGEYDKNLLDVGTEIKAMEKVFQKVLPELTDNVAQLSRITKTAKPKAPVKKTK